MSPSTASSGPEGELHGDNSRKRARPNNPENHPSALSSRIIPTFARPVKRLKRDAPFSESYSGLLEDEIQSAQLVHTGQTPYETGLVGISEWTGPEKLSFFQALDIYGRDNVRAISTRVQTKTEPEVEAYIELLQAEANKLRHNASLLQEPTSAEDAPSAYDLSPYCEDVLEDAADGVATQALGQEEQNARLRYHDAWLLTPTLVERMRKGKFRMGAYLREKGINPAEELRALELLDLETLLSLSENYFMTSEDDQWSWKTYAVEGESPSIQLCALVALSRLTTAFTERLLLTALHCARARHRAMKIQAARGQSKPIPEGRRPDLVKPQDIQVALKILKITNPGVCESPREFWKSVIGDLSSCDQRRLEYFDTIIATAVDEELAKRLEAGKQAGKVTRVVKEDIRLRSQQWQALLKLPEAENIEHEDTGSTYESRDSSSESSQDDSDFENPEPTEDSTEAYREGLDAEASRKEELRLLRLCGGSAPHQVSDDEGHVHTGMEYSPATERDTGVEEDWRDSLYYQSEWESYPNPIPEQAFASAVKATESDSSTDSGALSQTEHITEDKILEDVAGDTSAQTAAPQKDTSDTFDDLYDVSDQDEDEQRSGGSSRS